MSRVNEDLYSMVVEFCDQTIPTLDALEGTALVLALYLRQARTVAKQLHATAKLAREKEEMAQGGGA